MKLPININKKIDYEFYSVELLKINVYHIEEHIENPSSIYCVIGTSKVLWINLWNQNLLAIMN